MSKTATKTTHWNLASLDLQNAYTDFILSRQAMNSSPKTIEFYKYTAGAFLTWIENQGVTDPVDISARHVRQYLAARLDQGKKDTTLHADARAIKTLLRFWYSENYIPETIHFEMPKLEKKRQPVLDADQLQAVLKACTTREKALILFMVDSGLRRSEVAKLNWSDIDFQSGSVEVKQGKGKKDRVAAIGATTRRALLKYRQTQTIRNGAVFLSEKTGSRLTSMGIMHLFRRLSKRTGIYFTAHAMRRTFTILSLRAGMSPLHLQHLGGWSDLTMVDHYSQMEDIDLLQEHRAHSPIDNLKRE
jgi:site-specific recombinase XerD